AVPLTSPLFIWKVELKRRISMYIQSRHKQWTVVVGLLIVALCGLSHIAYGQGSVTQGSVPPSSVTLLSYSVTFPSDPVEIKPYTDPQPGVDRVPSCSTSLSQWDCYFIDKTPSGRPWLITLRLTNTGMTGASVNLTITAGTKLCNVNTAE